MKIKGLTKAEKREWIMEYLLIESPVDILNGSFVDSYIEKFKPKYSLRAYGAHECKDLGKQLSEMYKIGLLKRFTVSIPNSAQGFPKWIYTYESR